MQTMRSHFVATEPCTADEEKLFLEAMCPHRGFPRSDWPLFHDDVIKWKHFPRYWHFAGNSPVPSEFPSQRPVTRSFDVFFGLRLNKRLRKQS